ncbi:hypothetical protein ACTWP4_02710 [Gracilibacillus sp. D59]|uniref:hypothetical protein n=1 Tax=Gracilibacillus sp. D59 TaxID=3457434 RepID=UPI003FCD967E
MHTFKNELNQIEKILYLIIIVLLFHVTRNINMIFYVGLLFSLYIYLFIVFFLYKKNTLDLELRFYTRELIFLFSLLLIPIISFINLPFNEFLVGFPRFFVLMPFLLFLIIYKQLSVTFVKMAFRTVCIFMGLSSLSILYQIVFGPLMFLADSTVRSGLERYASLAGSLTAMGTIGSLAILILLFSKNWLFNRFIKYSLIIIISLGMLLSLQKASVINLIICAIIYILLNFSVQQFIRSITSIIFIIIISLIVYNFTDTFYLEEYIDTIVNYTLNQDSDRTSEDLMNRLTDKPARVFEFHSIGLMDIILGIGFASLAGVMGLNQYPMAHNAYVDLLLSGGIIHFISYLFLNLYVVYKALITVSNTVQNIIIKKIYISIVLLTLINMIIGSGKFYQPVQGVITFIVLFTFIRINQTTNEFSTN